MIIEQGRILANHQILPHYWCLDIIVPQIAAAAQPGQFVMVTPSKGLEIFLKRPMSLNRIDRQGGSIRIIYKIHANGTKAISQIGEGEKIDILGPLGYGWQIEQNCRRALLIGGGSGVASLLPLAIDLSAENTKIDILIGAASKDELFCLDEFSAFAEVSVATDDGSFGTCGLVSGIFPVQPNYDTVYACGPRAMLKAVQQWTEQNNLPCQLSLEEKMGCGLGTCMGCVCSAKDADGNINYRRVCHDGPVFNSKEVEL